MVVHPHLIHTGVNLPAVPAGTVPVCQGIYGVFLVFKFQLKLVVFPNQLSLEGAVSDRCLHLLHDVGVVAGGLGYVDLDDIAIGIPCLKFGRGKEPVQIAHGYLHAKDSQHPSVLSKQGNGIGNHILILLVNLKRRAPVSQPF